jgi:farnesyl-diphosphate farnesyltransferase
MQLMAIATLDKLASNPDVFTGVVKIRKGLALKLLLGSTDIQVRFSDSDRLWNIN